MLNLRHIWPFLHSFHETSCAGSEALPMFSFFVILSIENVKVEALSSEVGKICPHV
jgi:hypothetical protein